MKKLYVVAKNKSHVEQLMRPYNLEHIVPKMIEKEELVNAEWERIKRDAETIKGLYDTEEDFKKFYKDQPAYISYIVDVAMPVLKDERNAIHAVWEHICEEYGITKADMIPNGKILRRFNDLGRWDHYEIRDERIEVSEIASDKLDTSSDLLLPNYLWVDSNDSDYPVHSKIRRAKEYKDHYLYSIHYYN